MVRFRAFRKPSPQRLSIAVALLYNPARQAYVMDIFQVLDQVRERLQQEGRLSYRILKLQFQLDEQQLEVLKEELMSTQALNKAVDRRSAPPGCTCLVRSYAKYLA